MTNRRILWVVVLLAALALRTSATLMIPLSLEELQGRADLILHATVKSKTCERTTEGRIITRVRMDVSEVLKGVLKTNTFEIVHGGGVVGDVRAEVSGQVEYKEGEEVVAFLVLNQRGEGVTLGLAQGKFRVWRDAQTGEKFAHNPFHGSSEAESRTARPSTPQSSGRLSLVELTKKAGRTNP